MGLTLSTAIQYAEDCIGRGMNVDEVLRRFTFFFDISISFFEEVAKFRAGRRIWARITKERLGAQNSSSWRFKFHGQTSGVDLTVQQPLNNIARVSTQAIAGILSGLQSMHTDAFDEAVSCPTERTALIAVATQNILREEARLCDVIDPLAGSYYVESLTDQMEEKILAIIEKIQAAGGMYEAARRGLVQSMIGASAIAHQQRIDRGEQKIVGVNAYAVDEPEDTTGATERPDLTAMKRLIAEFVAYKAARSTRQVNQAIDNLRRAAANTGSNIFEQVIAAAEAGVTHGEIVGALRQELGFGHPLVVA
jgi:methylmalonyl-CoA mutase N-terminal domain/subunit